jgi:hypothetical protein
MNNELDHLSNKEIKELWDKTQKELRRQMGYREAEAQSAADILEHDGEYYRDNWGNLVEGRRPAPKTTGHYIDAQGYVRELAVGEKAPELSGNGLVDWLNNQDIAGDQELRDALGDDALYFESELKLHDESFWIVGQLESEGWSVTARSQSRKSKDVKFRLPKNLSRDEAIEQATAYVRIKAGPQFRDLTENECRMCERMAIGDRISAFVFYIQARLPEDLADRFLRLGATGNELAIQHFAADEKISGIAEEAVVQTFRWNNVQVGDDFIGFVQSNHGGRIITFALLDTLWNQYQASPALNKLDTQDAPTAEDLDQMSDEEIATTLTEARKLRSHGRY